MFLARKLPVDRQIGLTQTQEASTIEGIRKQPRNIA